MTARIRSDLVSHMIVALPTRIPPDIQIYTLNTFGELAVTCTPLRLANIDQIPYIFPVFTPSLTD